MPVIVLLAVLWAPPANWSPLTHWREPCTVFPEGSCQTYMFFKEILQSHCQQQPTYFLFISFIYGFTQVPVLLRHEMLTMLGVLLGSWWPFLELAGERKGNDLYKESCSENVVTDDLGLHRLLPFGNVLLLLVLTCGLKKPSGRGWANVDQTVNILQNLVWVLMGVKKIYVFCKGKSAVSVLLLLNIDWSHSISSISFI